VRRNGRPTKISPEIQGAIALHVEAGNYPEVAAQAEGISKATYYRWMQRGEEDEAAGRRTVYREFRERITRARAKAQTYYVGLLLRNADERSDSRAIIEYLARTDPARWGRKDVVVSKGVTADLTSGQVSASAGVAGANGAANKLWEELSKDDWLAEYGRTLEDLGLLDVATAKADGGAEADAQVDQLHPDHADAEAGDLSK
jgi:hypothetical protein